MAEEMNNNGMTPYEMVKVAHMSNRGDRAVGIVALVIAGVVAVAGVTGWVYANSQAKRAQEVELTTSIDVATATTTQETNNSVSPASKKG